MDAGDALRNLRHSKLSNYSDNEIEHWESKISRRGKEDLKRLEDRHPRILRALDQLIVYPGLWPDISVTFIRRLVECSCPIVSMSCQEAKESIHFLLVTGDL